MLLFVWKVVSGRTADHTFFLVLPVLLRLADVGLVAQLSHLLSLGEELLGLADSLQGLSVRPGDSDLFA